MKKKLASALSLLLTLGIVASCSPGTNGTESVTTSEGATTGGSTTQGSTETGDDETVPMLYVVPGDEPAELGPALELINEEIAKDKGGVEVSLQYIPWDAWDQRLNLMLSTGEKFDMFTVMNDRVTISNYASRNALADLTDIVAEYGENILKYNPEIMMQSGMVDGRQYAIPAYWFESALGPELTMRKDIMEKYGIEKEPETFEELTEQFEKVMAEWEGPVKPYFPLIGAGSYDFGLMNKTYDEYPFFVYDGIFFVTQDGKVQNFFETDVFAQNSKNARIWYEKGLINPDVLVYTNDQLTNQLNSGDWFIHPGTIGNIEPLKANYPDITVDDFLWIDFAPDKPDVRPYGTRNMQAIPLSSEHPEAGVKFINWLYADQDNYDLFMYGREGIDYDKVEPKGRVSIIDPAYNTPLYYFSDWMIGNVQFERTDVNAPTVTNENLYVANENAVDSIAAGMQFDASEVQTLLADVKTQMSAAIAPIATGVKTYDDNIDEALDLLKKAGIDDLIAEFQAQLDAHLASN